VPLKKPTPANHPPAASPTFPPRYRRRSCDGLFAQYILIHASIRGCSRSPWSRRRVGRFMQALTAMAQAPKRHRVSCSSRVKRVQRSGRTSNCAGRCGQMESCRRPAVAGCAVAEPFGDRLKLWFNDLQLSQKSFEMPRVGKLFQVLAGIHR